MVDQVALIQEERAMPSEHNVPIFLCRKPITSIQEKWPEIRRGF